MIFYFYSSTLSGLEKEDVTSIASFVGLVALKS